MEANLERSEDIIVCQEYSISKRIMIRGKCIWSKEEGSGVYQDEVIGYFVTQEGIRILLRAPISGKLANIHFSVFIIINSHIG